MRVTVVHLQYSTTLLRRPIGREDTTYGGQWKKSGTVLDMQKAGEWMGVTVVHLQYNQWRSQDFFKGGADFDDGEGADFPAGPDLLYKDEN